MDIHKTLNSLAEKHRDDITLLASRLIQIPSESGEEGNLARFLTDEMKKLGFDEVHTDKAGNVIGIIRGTGGGENILFNCHMDHVSPGNRADWEFDPYGGTVSGGYVHGRAASDTKGAMAAQIYAGYLLKEAGIQLKGDVYFTFVIDEEPGDMVGMRLMCDGFFKDIPIALGVLGEATSLDIYLGHRGRAEIEIFSRGKMSHSSAPWLGINAVSEMLPVLTDIEKLSDTMPDDKILGASTQVITHISCQPGWGSTLPDICKVIIDRRYIPTESSQSALNDILAIIDRHMKADSKMNITAQIRTMRHTSYTGVVQEEFMDKPAYYVPPENPYVVKTVEALKEIGQNPSFGKWNFGTDGAYTAHDLNIPTIGYSCCEEIYAHRSNDRVNIDFMVKCAAGSSAIAIAVAK